MKEYSKNINNQDIRENKPKEFVKHKLSSLKQRKRRCNAIQRRGQAKKSAGWMPWH